ncbi:MAG: phosphomannomutase/phosphoglucomutase [Patescibacteria group bacterium]
MNQDIFRSYDIRGVYPTEINAEASKQIAKAFLSRLSSKLNKPVEKLRIMVARDIRHGSEPLVKAAIEIFLQYGVEVYDIGLVSINDFYFATGKYKYDGGFMATASHNPPQYAGCKLTTNNPEYTDSIQFITGKQIASELEKINLPDTAGIKPGKLKTKEISRDHLQHILSFVDLSKIKPLKIVVDSGGGMTSQLLPKIFAKLPGQFIHLFPELDPDFLKRPPNPLTKGASRAIAEKIKQERADFGVMFDADGDRLFLLDEKGEFIRSDVTILLLAKLLLEKNPGAGIVYNLVFSHAVPELIKKWGGKAIRSEVGYINLSRHMHHEFGIMSGEVSGHFAFQKNYYADSGFIAMLLAIQAISEDGRKLSAIGQDFSLYYRTDEYNLEISDTAASLEKVRQHYKDDIRDELDGITVELADWWFNVRPSNTESLLRVTVEAKDKESAEAHQQEVLAVIKN